MSKKDMYIDYSYDKGRGKNKGRRNNKKTPPNIFLIILLIAVAIVLGVTIYSSAKEGRLYNLFSKGNEETGEEADDSIGEELDENIDGETIDKGDTDTGDDDHLADSGKLDNEDGLGGFEDSGELEDESIYPGNQDSIPARGQPVKAKGIYVTGPIAGHNDRMNELIDLVKETELNAMVIDVKNDDGEITYKMDNEIVQEIGASVNYIRNPQELIQELKDLDIYLIARIVAFKDPLLADKKADLSLKNTDGSQFRDKDGLGWVNPYNLEVWDYLVDISLEAIELGFDEIQFDYIRFSTDKRMANVDFGPEAATKSKTQVITDFTEYAYERLSPYAYVSADVYGAIIDSKIDQDIVGQDYANMAKHLDYICPMIYPSHYHDGAYGIPYPDLEPYNLILASLEASKEVLSLIAEDGHLAEVRPWLQDFTAPWIANYQRYGPQQIREQIQGVYDAGYEEWILWNGSNRYTRVGLLE